MEQTTIEIIIGAFISVGAWFIKTMFDSIKELQRADTKLAEKVNEIETLVAGAYVKRDYFEKIALRFEDKLDRIYDLMSQKADK